MREIKFSIILQHEETGRIVDRRFSYDEIFNGTAKEEIGKLSGYAVIARREYIGLPDRLGKEIYEGDIVAPKNTPESVKSIVRIGESEIEVDIYDDSISRPYYGVYLEGSINLEQLLLRGEMEVIGNIYENPELLGKSEDGVPYIK